MRSRVMPGSSPVMARRDPVMRLKRVDFPTLGLPTMTTVGMAADMKPHNSSGASKRWYPIFLDLESRPVLVVGAGKVALRKTRGLIEAGARVTVIAPRHRPEFEALPVRLVGRAFRPSDLAGAVLVFAATN